MTMRRKSEGTAEGANALPSVDAAVDGRPAAECRTDVPKGAWDPYEVWLTRVKQPRDRRALRKSCIATPPSSSADTSDTARLRALSPVLPR